MGIFSRLSDIINSNLNSLLDKAEDPEKLIRLIIQEMEDTLVELRSTAARTIADKKEIERRAAALDRDAADWQAKAELAISKGRDDLAKGALREKARAADRQEALRGEVEHIDVAIKKYGEDIGLLQAKLDDARKRQKSLLVRRSAAASQIKVRVQLSSGRVDEAMNKFEHFERRLDEDEATVESFDLGRKRTLAEEISELEKDDEVEKELAELKQRMGGAGGERP